MYARPDPASTPEKRIRGQLRDSLGARVLTHRADLDDLLLELKSLRAQGPPEQQCAHGGGVFLDETDDAVELLAQASWDSSPTERVERYGPWDDLRDDDARRLTTLDGARRTLHFLLTGEALPEN